MANTATKHVELNCNRLECCLAYNSVPLKSMVVIFHASVAFTHCRQTHENETRMLLQCAIAMYC